MGALLSWLPIIELPVCARHAKQPHGMWWKAIPGSSGVIMEDIFAIYMSSWIMEEVERRQEECTRDVPPVVLEGLMRWPRLEQRKLQTLRRHNLELRIYECQHRYWFRRQLVNGLSSLCVRDDREEGGNL